MWISKEGLKAITGTYEARIIDLKSEIDHLRKMVSPAASAYDIPVPLREADAILSNDGQVREYTEEEVGQAMAEQSEAARILAGNYE